jgi:hypothetical protein
MLKDIHKDLGPKTRVSSTEDALARVRQRWPAAFAEGSTGYQRSFWIHGDDREAEFVGHCWEIRGREDAFWLRVRSA